MFHIGVGNYLLICRMFSEGNAPVDLWGAVVAATISANQIPELAAG